MKSRVRFVLVAFILGAPVLVAGGCGGDTASSGTSGPVSPDQFPAAAAHTICSNIGPCCQAAGKPFTEGNCEIVLKQFYKAFLPSNAPATTIPGECMDAIGASVRTCNFSPASDNPACAGVGFGSSSRLHGKAGDLCDWSCTKTGSSTSCGFSGSGNQPDAGTFYSCFSNDGLYCDGETYRCVAQVGVGSPCSADEACKDSYCPYDFSSGTPAPRVCAPKLGAGGDCSSNSSACGDGLYCDYSGNGQCTAQKADGTACSGSDECTSGRCSNKQCGADTNTMLELACVP